MSVGLNKRNVFFMVVFETLFISLVAAPIGIFLFYSFILLFWNSWYRPFFCRRRIRRTRNWNKNFYKLSFDNYINITIFDFDCHFFLILNSRKKSFEIKSPKQLEHYKTYKYECN